MGSNLGDRLGNPAAGPRPGARAAWRVASGRIVVSAPLYETDPVDCPPGSGTFLNTVMEIDDPGHPPTAGLCSRPCAGSKPRLGRPSRYPRNAPRPLDLDILYAGNVVLDTPTLTLPHPRLASGGDSCWSRSPPSGPI